MPFAMYLPIKYRPKKKLISTRCFSLSRSTELEVSGKNFGLCVFSGRYSKARKYSRQFIFFLFGNVVLVSFKRMFHVRTKFLQWMKLTLMPCCVLSLRFSLLLNFGEKCSPLRHNYHYHGFCNFTNRIFIALSVVWLWYCVLFYSSKVSVIFGHTLTLNLRATDCSTMFKCSVFGRVNIQKCSGQQHSNQKQKELTIPGKSSTNLYAHLFYVTFQFF